MTLTRQEISADATALGVRNAAAMDMRQYIAVQALQGILAHSYNDATLEGAARDAVVHADALLEELAK